VRWRMLLLQYSTSEMAHVVTAVQHEVRWRMLLLQYSTK